MASSMVQMCAPNEHFEGSSAALLFSSQLAFDCANPFTWQPTKSCSPVMEGPFTPAPNLITSSHAELQGDPDNDHDYSFMNAIAKNISYADLLSLNTSQLSADLDMEYLPLAEEMQLGLQRKLGILYNGGSYGDDDDIALATQPSIQAQASSMGGAAAAADHDQLLQACSYGDDVKLSHLARSQTFPPAARARPTSSNVASSSPLLIASSDAHVINHRINHGRFLSNKNTCREISSSATTTSCSGGQPDGQSKAKVVQIKSESSEMPYCQNQQEHSQHVGTTKGPKQSKKRSATIGTSITRMKMSRIETPPDVVHVRARRGQATDSHSLAERVRREKISQRMKVLQEIVPGCHKVLGKAMMLDEIINYVKSLQRQVEFLSMKLAAANQAGIASMIIDKANYTASNMEIFGDLRASQLQLMQLQPLISSLMQ